jgi:hypothetical protein
VAIVWATPDRLSTYDLAAADLPAITAYRQG